MPNVSKILKMKNNYTTNLSHNNKNADLAYHISLNVQLEETRVRNQRIFILVLESKLFNSHGVNKNSPILQGVNIY